MPSTPALQAPTGATLRKLGFLRNCVLIIYFTFFVRILPDPFGALNDLLCALFGTFLLNEDKTLAGCYRCLRNSPLGMMGDGGMACLVPFTLICMINGIINLLKSIVMMVQMGTPLPCVSVFMCYLPLVQFIGGLAEIFACYIGWRIYQEISSQQQGYDAPPTQQQGGGFFSRNQDPESGSPAAAQPFVPFEGSGNRLGD